MQFFFDLFLIAAETIVEQNYNIKIMWKSDNNVNGKIGFFCKSNDVADIDIIKQGIRQQTWVIYLTNINESCTFKQNV